MPVRPIHRAALLGGLVALLAGCAGLPASPSANEIPSSSEPSASATPYPPPSAGAFPAGLVDGLRAEVDVPFTDLVDCGSRDCALPLDILAPMEGVALPTIVLQPGGPGTFTDRRYLADLAAELARNGAIVFLATYRSEVHGMTESEMLHDARCSVRYARSVTGEYGGDPETVVMVGHSLGSNLVIQTGINPETDTPACLADGDGIPEAVVGLSEFVFSLADSAESGPPFWFVAGADDALSVGGEQDAQELRDAGFEVDFRELAGTDHIEMVDPNATPEVIDVIFEAAGVAGGS